MDTRSFAQQAVVPGDPHPAANLPQCKCQGSPNDCDTWYIGRPKQSTTRSWPQILPIAMLQHLSIEPTCSCCINLIICNVNCGLQLYSIGTNSLYVLTNNKWTFNHVAVKDATPNPLPGRPTATQLAFRYRPAAGTWGTRGLQSGGCSILARDSQNKGSILSLQDPLP